MTDEPTLSEVIRVTDRHEAKISWIEQHYISEKFYLAMSSAISERILALEQADTTKSTGNRAWILSLAQMVIGVVLGVVAGLVNIGGH